ncbi:hypothetical protein PYCCODRAFT_1466106 [Trametes coccinea BRFM310]|uniref:Uncharacterized protein n=1 Tax=Trametes coccinea (strain BRFM310) TaxID=1353009 RepID=A0A1Y2IU36_TRAC3|nr:hypothetical protein PYCCODRAFT_1466106 [Trametes coccinea BRFM310]
MSEPAIVAEGASRPSSGAERNGTVAEGRAQQKQQDQPNGSHANAPEVDMEIMSVLAATQNNCFAELGYYPTLLHDFHELKKQCALLKSDNQKLYADNRNLAMFIQTQQQRVQMLSAPVDQQKRTLAELHERVRVLSAERDEIAGRLHAALNEILLLRQELSRFIPNARVVPANERLPPSQTVPQRVVSMPPPQRMVAEQPPNLSAYQQQPPGQQQQRKQQQQLTRNRPIQPLPAHRHSQGNVSPSSSTAPPPTIAHLRRTSAPAPLATSQNGAAPSPVSASLNAFSGLSLASPVTPMSGQMPTTDNPSNAPPGDFAPPPPPLSTSPLRTIHTIPVPSKPSPSSLAGAVVDLTADEPDESAEQDLARKRRKMDHTPDTSMEVQSRPPSAPKPSHMSEPSTSAEVTVSNGHVPPDRSTINTVPPPSSSVASPPDSIRHDTPDQQSTSNNAALPSPPSPLNEDEDMEQQTTLEEDCLGANFAEDDDDERKLWCRISRYQKGHITEPPTPFVGVPERELIEHCETVHPQGWKILKERMAKMRAADEPV